jgi:methionyl-tRNA formyltransferase
VPPEAVDHLNGEVVIAHDSLLPRLRGFAPLPTALIVGEPHTGVTLIRAGPGVDDGDVLWQKSIAIGPADTIADLIDRVIPLYREGAGRYLRGELVDARPQDKRLATYSIWRDELDYRIDWSESADRIERTVRALGPPYLGARSTLGGEEVVLHRAEVMPDLEFAIRQPGKVWSLDADGRPTVVCGKGCLKILAASAGGKGLFPLKSLRQRFTS